MVRYLDDGGVDFDGHYIPAGGLPDDEDLADLQQTLDAINRDLQRQAVFERRRNQPRSGHTPTEGD